MPFKMDTALLTFLILFVLEPVQLFHLSTKERKLKPKASEVALEAIQKLQEVFAFGELPQNITPAKKPPQFMLELYSRVARPDGSTKASGILEGNVVRSFEKKVLSEGGSSIFFFNISSMASKEIILKAELRVFKFKPLVMPVKHHFCTVDVYDLIDDASRPWKGNLIASRLLPLHSQGWEMFNVTQTVSGWVGDDRTNHGFLITVSILSGKTKIPGLNVHKLDAERSYLVLFSDDGQRPVPNPYTPPTAVKETGTDHHSSLAAPSHPMIPKIRRTRDAYTEAFPQCQLKPLYVDFEEIGWSGWIISPKGYNAYHCQGMCLFPMGKGLGATNHATVQSIVYALKLHRDIDTPCCVPDSLNSINLLYFDDEGNVVLKQYVDMVAMTCGCH